MKETSQFEDDLLDILIDFKHNKITYDDIIVKIEEIIMRNLGLQQYMLTIYKGIDNVFDNNKKK